MKTDENGDIDALRVVRSFLHEYYFPEEWETRANVRALEAQARDLGLRVRIARAFVDLLAMDLAKGTLREIVETSANREVYNDEEAREFLERVYEANDFEDALDFDDDD